MPAYYIEWRIELDADSPREAAELALAMQRDPDSTAVVFHVQQMDDHDSDPACIDLLE